MAEVVLDASALMAVIFGEPGEQVVRRLAATAASAVNLSEVHARSVERGLSEAEIEAAISKLVEEPYSFSVGDGLLAARLRPLTRHLGLSLADRACLALGQRLGLPVYTADRRWKKLDIGVDVRLIR